MEQTNLDNNKNKVEEEDEGKSVFDKIVQTISGSFLPFLGALAATGMIKGLTNLLLTFNLIDPSGGAFLIFSAIGDSLFRFLPFFIAYSSAKAFRMNPFTGMVLGAVLLYPSLQLSELSAAGEPLSVLFAGTSFESAVYVKFLGIPFLAQNYASSVVPIIFITWLASKVEKIAFKVVPEVVQTFIVPLLVVLVAGTLGLLLVGPVITVLSNLVGLAFGNIHGFSPLLSGLVIGFVYQVLVIFGVHWGLLPIVIINFGLYGYDPVLLPAMFAASFSQVAAILAMSLKMKSKKQKALVIPAAISGIFGITEPAIYTFTLPAKKPFLFSMIGASIGGAIMSASFAVKYAIGGLGVFGIINFIDPATGSLRGVYISLISMVVAMAISFALTFFFWKDTNTVEEE